MGLVLHLQAVFQGASGLLLFLELAERCHRSALPLSAVLQVFRCKLLLIPGRLPFQFFGLPPPREAPTNRCPKDQCEHRQPRLQGHQISTCSARL